MNENHYTRRVINVYRYNIEEEPEKWLWKSVICQALIDASSMSKSKEDKKLKIEAIQWFNDGDSDFIDVAELAGLNPKILQETARLFIRNYHLQ